MTTTGLTGKFGGVRQFSVGPAAQIVEADKGWTRPMTGSRYSDTARTNEA
jgi:hypothetical protein